MGIGVSINCDGCANEIELHIGPGMLGESYVCGCTTCGALATMWLDNEFLSSMRDAALDLPELYCGRHDEHAMQTIKPGLALPCAGCQQSVRVQQNGTLWD